MTTGETPLEAGLNLRMHQVREMVDAKGFSSEPERIWEMLALIHSEVSEAADAYKKGQSHEEVGEELIDATIRILHLLSALEVAADAVFDRKMHTNWERPHRYNTVRGG